MNAHLLAEFLDLVPKLLNFLTHGLELLLQLFDHGDMVECCG